MKDYEIREVNNSELDVCSEVIRRGFETVAKEFGLTRENCPTNGAFIKIKRLVAEREKGDLMFGVFINCELIAFMQLEKKSFKQYELKKITVLPTFRHKGYGKILLDFAKEKVKQLGGTKITIGIIEENTVLKEWYGANGFVHTGIKIFETLPFTVGFMEFDIIY